MQVHSSKTEAKGSAADRAVAGLNSDSRKRYQLLDECRESIMSKLNGIMGEALNQMAEKLSNDAMVSIKREEQQALLDAAAMVQLHRLDIVEKFQRSFGDIFERRLFATKSAETNKLSESFSADQLTLMSDDIMDDKIAVDRLVDKAKGKLDPSEVLGIRARFGALLDRDWFDEDAHPAAPGAIFEALRKSLSQFEAKPDVAAALLAALEPHISSNLNSIYAGVNERLVSRKVLPQLRPKIQAGHAGRRPNALPGSVAGSAPGTASVPGTAGGFGAATDDDIGYSSGVQRVNHSHPARAASPQMLDQRAYAAAQMLAGLDDPSAALAAMLASMAQGNPHARAHATRLIADPQSYELIDLPRADVATFVGQLSTLQDVIVDLSTSPSEVTQSVSDRLRGTGGPLDQLMIDVVSMVFDYIYRDDRIHDAVKQQLLRLQVVAIKAALIDKSFFARRQHPMRRFLEGVVDLAIDPESDTSQDSLICAGLTIIIDDVIENFSDDLAIFDEKLAQFEALVEREQSRREDWLALPTAEADAKDKEAMVIEEERTRLLERVDDNAPAFVRAFLLRWWPGVMAKLLNSGVPGAREQGVKISDALLWSVAPKAADEIPRLAALLPKLINGLTKALRMMSIEAEEREAFFNELLRSHTRAIETARQPVSAASKNSLPLNPRVVMDKGGSLQFKPRVDKREDEASYASTVTLGQATIDTFERGAMFSVTRDDGKVRRMKLSWISPSRKFFLLTRFPDLAVQLGRAELLSMLNDGRAIPIHTPPIVTRVLDEATSEIGPVNGSIDGPIAA